MKVTESNVALIEEWCILNGDSSSGAGLQFDGLDLQITSNITDMGSTAITLSALNTTMRNIVEQGGKPQCVVLSLRDHQKVSELILASYYRLTQMGAGSMADIPAGVAITRWVSPFGTVDLIPSRFISPAYGLTKAYVLDDKSMSNDGNAIAMVDLMPISAIDLALTGTAYKTLITEFSVLMLTIPIFQGKLVNISA